VLAIVEGVRFSAREDVLNEDKNLIDPNVLRPMSRIGGVAYGRVVDAVEIPRPGWAKEMKEGHVGELEVPKVKGQL